MSDLDKDAVPVNGKEALHLIEEAISKAKDDPGLLFEKPVIEALKDLMKTDKAGYVRCLTRVKRECKDVPLSLLKEDVGGGNGQRADAESAQGRPVEIVEPEPWETPVDGEAALDELLAAINRHMVIKPSDAVIVALWITHVHAFDAFAHTPRLLIDAPTENSGKTLLLRHIVGNAVTRPYTVELMKAAPFFRLAQKYRPCFLIDECDVFIKEDLDLLAAINNGWEPHGSVARCVPPDYDVMSFSTHAPVAMAGVKLTSKLPPTTCSRSLIITLERAIPGELKSIYDARIHREPILRTGRKLARWVADTRKAMAVHEPELPEGALNRLADKWRPLFVIAELAGGKWPVLVKQALAAQPDLPSKDKGVILLGDIKSVLGPLDENIATWDLIERLCRLPETGYADYNFKERDVEKRKITARQLSGLLDAFGVKPSLVRIGETVKRGYNRDGFTTAWKRYLTEDKAYPAVDPPPSSVTPLQPSNSAPSRPVPSVTREKDVTDIKQPEPAPDGHCNGVTDKTPSDKENGALRRVTHRNTRQTGTVIEMTGHGIKVRWDDTGALSGWLSTREVDVLTNKRED